MYAKTKGSQVPSDVQAKEKLALYVYDYLMHIGATKSAQTFLSEIRWEKQVQIGLTDPPGFLLSWWCVFWDLYCAAPERRDAQQNECSNEAKAFHDYGFINSGGYSVPNGMPNNSSHSPLTQMPPQENMPPNNSMQPNNYFSPNSQPPPPPQPTNPMMMQNQGYPRYPSGPRPMRVPSNSDYTGPNSAPGPQLNIESGRVPPGMSPISRLTPPGSRLQGAPQQQAGLQQMGNYNSPSQTGTPTPQVPPPPSQTPNMQMRGQPQGGPQTQLGPPQLSGPNAAMSPMPPMAMQQTQNRWPGGPGSSGPPINYSSPSPVPYGVGPHCPGTPIMQSPPDANTDINYAMMKGVPGGMGFHEANLPPHMVQMNSDMGHHTQHLNGDMIESLKNSPNSRHTGDEHQNAGSISDIGAYSHFGDGSAQNESDAILKLKESMQEETKRFEKSSHHDVMYSDST